MQVLDGSVSGRASDVGQCRERFKALSGVGYSICTDSRSGVKEGRMFQLGCWVESSKLFPTLLPESVDWDPKPLTQY